MLAEQEPQAGDGGLLIRSVGDKLQRSVEIEIMILGKIGEADGGAVRDCLEVCEQPLEAVGERRITATEGT